ncbi:MAG TPA: flippase [Chitinophagales bacterium]|nr:flippase [Chitinophagales bacterium]
MPFSKKSYWRNSAFYSLMERASFMLFGFGSIFFLLRLFSKNDFGTYALFITVTSTIEVARNGLIQNALVKHLASTDKQEHGAITTASVVLNILLTAITVILLFSLSGWLSRMWVSPALDEMLRIYSLTTVALIFLSQLIFIQQANFDFRGNFWGNVARQSSVFAYIAVCFFTDLEISLISLAWFHVAAAVLGGFVSYFFGKKYVVISGRLSWEWVKKLFGFGKFTLGTNVSTMLYKFIGNWMLGSLLKSPAAVGVFDLANRITNLVEVPTASMATIVFPQSARRAVTEGRSAIKHLYEKSVGIVLALIIPAVMVVWIFAEKGILIVAGKDYAESVPILKIALISGLLIPYARQFGTILDSIGKPKVNLWFVVGSATINIALNFIFIRQFGVMGAAFGALATAIIRVVLVHFILYHMLGVTFSGSLHHTADFYMRSFNFITDYAKKMLGRHRSAL